MILAASLSMRISLATHFGNQELETLTALFIIIILIFFTVFEQPRKIKTLELTALFIIIIHFFLQYINKLGI